MNISQRGIPQGQGALPGGRQALAAGLCALLLAACSAASDPTAQLGLAPGTAASSGETDGQTATAVLPVPTRRPDRQAAQAAPTPVKTADGEEAALAAAAPETETDESPRATAPSAEAAQTPEEKPAGDADTETARAGPDAGAEGETPQEATNLAAASEGDEADGEDDKGGFLSAFFGTRSAAAATAAESVTKTDDERRAERQAEDEASQPRVIKASASAGGTRPVAASMTGGEALPGVRDRESLFEISDGSDKNDGSLDLYEKEPAYQVASAAGLARLAPNGLLKQRESVDTACFKPALVRTLKSIERHFGKRLIVTSGYRSPSYNRRVNGARKSLHMYCAAADIQVPGVSKWELAKYVRAQPGRGGVGTYCHTKSVHVDIGPKRDWNWRCGRRN